MKIRWEAQAKLHERVIFMAADSETGPLLQKLADTLDGEVRKGVDIVFVDIRMLRMELPGN